MHEKNSFVTLTYSDEFLPEDGSVSVRHFQLFVKRLRKALFPIKIRYFGVGEYGEKTFRPHYHLIVFGADDYEKISEAWPYGHVVVGFVSLDSLAYVAGYVTKKLTKKGDPRLGGRHPEFSRMSLRPGIGADYMENVANVLTSKYGSMILKSGDVPMVLQHGKKKLPLGRYLRQRLRLEVGIENQGLNHPQLLEKALEMRNMFKGCGATSKAHKKAVLVEKNRQKIRNIEVKYSIFRKKEKL